MSRTALTGVEINPGELIQLRLSANKLVLPGQRRSGASQGGQQHSRFRGRGMDYQESRGYQPGDDIRTMDWRVTARTGKPHTKIYQEERERPVFLLIDCNPSMDFGSRVSLKKVVAARLAALLAWAAIRHGDRVGAFLFGAFGHHELPPRGGRNSVLRLIRALTDWNASSTDTSTCDIATVLQNLRRVVRPGSLVFLISDFYQLSQDAERHLMLIRRHNDLVACQILDPLEQAPPPPGLYGISNGTQLSFFNSRSAPGRQRYRQLFEARQQQLLALTERFAIPLLSFTTHGDLLPTLQQGLAQRRATPSYARAEA
ncbi:MAG: DUF58 domain-containing protein [Candidatus Competibacteraceae bacterium]|nr:DUF58 domain-containing protein [Candidatus Competibacteraceae bacterium]MCB1811544.1 DUF58 domain-containing protein [Candidatus Competibacteraceae bacterium]